MRASYVMLLVTVTNHSHGLWQNARIQLGMEEERLLSPIMAMSTFMNVSKATDEDFISLKGNSELFRGTVHGAL